MALIDLNKKFLEIKEAVGNVNFTDMRLPDLFKSEYEKYLSENKANGYAKVEWANFSTKITTSTGKTIFLTNVWFYIALELSKYLDSLSQQKTIFSEIYKEEDLQEVATRLRGGVSDKDREKISEHFRTNSLTEDDSKAFFSFISDYKSWGGGKTIDRSDYYVSPLLQAGNLLAETQSAIAEIAKQMSENPVLSSSFKTSYVPFEVAKINTSIIKSSGIRDFVNQVITYLFENTLSEEFFCHIQESQDSKYLELVWDDVKIYRLFRVSESELSDLDLSSGSTIRYFNTPFVHENRYLYLTNQWADNDGQSKNSRDVMAFAKIFNKIYSSLEIIKSAGAYNLIEKSICNFLQFKLYKPFLLLAGISGTGKTRFVREQAELTGSLADTYCLTSVRPDWHEPSDLLGYVSRLSGCAEFVVTDVLKFIAKAWREILDKGISLSVNEKLLCLQGGVSDIDAIKPYWLCLDEMNLAPVEQYFADYLSVIETRSWAWDEDDFQYSCDPLLKATTIQSIDNIEKLREELGFADANYDDAWQHICEYGLSIPFNLIVAGTVNMDETTHGFSRKVIDRALSFDFGDFFPNDFDNYFAPTTTNKALSYPIYSDARTSTDKLPKIDIDGRKSIAFINAINNVLAHTPFKLAYRALNELLLAVISSEPKEEVDLKAVWDDFLMCKVLPRIEGDTEKLAAIGSVDISILKQLEGILESEFGSFWNELPSSDKARPDLYRENVGGDKLIHIACRSKEKIKWMEDRLTTFGFTSFWP